MDLSTLTHWVNINSGSTYPTGLSAMADALQERLRAIPGNLERIAVPEHRGPDGVHYSPGDALRLRFRPEAPVKILFSGHMDTVYGPDHPFQQLRELPDGRLNGPGVADMKGGLFIMIEAVDRFLQADNAGIVGGELLITADEEVGSTGSRKLLLEAAAWNDIGLVYESSLPGGELVRCRKGSGNFRLLAIGKSAHTGRDFENGRNAIVGLADLVLGCHKLNSRIPDAIVNVGKITGGGAVNVVPDQAVAALNIRISEPATINRIRQALHDLIRSAAGRHPGIRFKLEGDFIRPPKTETVENAALHALWNRAEEMVSLPPSAKRDTGGGSDGNNLGAAGLPHLDGIGIRGGAIHSGEEFALPQSIPEQIDKTVAFLNLISVQPDCLPRPSLPEQIQ